MWRELANWGEFRVGVRRGTGRSHVLIGDPASAGRRSSIAAAFFARFSYDKLDSIFFPRRGQQFEFEWRGERESTSAPIRNSTPLPRVADRALDRSPHVHLLDRHGDDGRRSADGPRISSRWVGSSICLVCRPGSLSGPHYGIARLIYYRKIGRGGSGVLDLPAYVGISLEAGNTWLEGMTSASAICAKTAAVLRCRYAARTGLSRDRLR